MSKKIWLFACLAILMGILPAPIPAQTKLEIVWMGWPKDMVGQLITEFESLNPNVKVDIQLVPFPQLFQTLEVRLSSGTTPDVYIVDGPITPSYAARGNLLPLDSAFPAAAMKSWFPASVETGTYKGKLYTIPYTTSSAGLFYNPAPFREAGLALPPAKISERLTWEEVAEKARKLTLDRNADKQIDCWGLIIEQVDRPYQLLPLIQSKGGQAISPDGLSTKGIFTAPAFLEATKFYWKLFNEWKVSPQGLKDAAQSREYFGNQKGAMMLGAEWNINRLASFKGLEFGMSPHPFFKGGKAVTPTGSWHVGVNARTRQVEASIAFVRFITSKDAIFKWFKLFGHAPARPDAYEVEPALFASPMWQTLLYEMKNTAVARPVTPGFLEYETILREAFNSIHFGADPEPTLADASRRIDRELAKYR